MSDEKLMEEVEQQPAQEETQEKDWAVEAQKFQDLYLRSAAEMENMRRRFQKEREDQAKFAAEKLIKGLLPVLDNLQLALGYIKDDASAEVLALAEGVNMTLNGFLGALADNGVKPVASERGTAFDPNVHDALGQMPETADSPAGTIGQEIQKGYTLYDRLIRPAKVMVTTSSQ